MSENTDFGDDFTPTSDDIKASDIKLAMEQKELDEKIAADKAAEETASAAKEAEDKAALEAKEAEEATKLAAEEKVDDEEGKDDKRSKVIPRERFDAAQNKAKAREEAYKAKIEELEKATSATKLSADLTKLQSALETAHDKYEDAVIEGNKAEARAARHELTKLQDIMIEVRTNVSSEAAKRETISELKYDAALAKAESEHPQLNPDSDSYDETLTDEVGVLLEAFVLRGFTRDAALHKAVRYVVGDAPAKDPDNIDPKKLAATRAEESRKKAAEASRKQPAITTKTGLDTDKAGNKDDIKDVDIMRISQERFSKLSEEQLARLRGDIL